MQNVMTQNTKYIAEECMTTYFMKHNTILVLRCLRQALEMFYIYIVSVNGWGDKPDIKHLTTQKQNCARKLGMHGTASNQTILYSNSKAKAGVYLSIDNCRLFKNKNLVN